MEECIAKSTCHAQNHITWEPVERNNVADIILINDFDRDTLFFDKPDKKTIQLALVLAGMSLPYYKMYNKVIINDEEIKCDHFLDLKKRELLENLEWVKLRNAYRFVNKDLRKITFVKKAGERYISNGKQRVILDDNLELLRWNYVNTKYCSKCNITNLKLPEWLSTHSSGKTLPKR